MQSVTLLKCEELLSLFRVKDDLATLTDLLEEYIFVIQQPCTVTLSLPRSQLEKPGYFFAFGSLTWTSS